MKHAVNITWSRIGSPRLFPARFGFRKGENRSRGSAASSLQRGSKAARWRCAAELPSSGEVSESPPHGAARARAEPVAYFRSARALD